MSRDNVNGEITFDIIEHIGVLATYTTGWKKEINLVSWNNAPGKYDIREWDPSHERKSKGITLRENEMRTLLEVMRRRHRGSMREDAPESSEDLCIETDSTEKSADSLNEDEAHPLEFIDETTGEISEQQNYSCRTAN